MHRKECQQRSRLTRLCTVDLVETETGDIVSIGEAGCLSGRRALVLTMALDVDTLLCGLQFFLNHMWLAIIKRGAKTDIKAGLVFQEIFSYIKASAVHIIWTLLCHLLCMSWLAQVVTPDTSTGIIVRYPPQS